ncbi:MAG: hypothetical protein ACFCU8_16960 [Thermosynechococcaceae cyanobacterium]
MQVRTLPWLLRHEWRLWCRHQYGLTLLVSTSKQLLGISLICEVGLIAVGFFKNDFGYPVEYLLEYLQRNLPQNPDAALWMAVVAWFWMFFFNFLEISKYLNAVLTQSSSLPAFVSSPLRPQHLFTAKYAKVAGATLLRQAPLFLCC